MPDSHQVLVPPARLGRWLENFARRHPEPSVRVDDGSLLLRSPDGAEAAIELPGGSLTGGPDTLAELQKQAGEPRRLGALLVRRKAHAVGIFDSGDLVTHALGRHYVQGRTKAGGWSQQRYARRRDNQADRAFAKATRSAAEILLPQVNRLDGLILGGDADALRTVLAAPELAPLVPLAEANRHRLAVPDPNLAVLKGAWAQHVAVRITLNAAARDRSALAERDDQGND